MRPAAAAGRLRDAAARGPETRRLERAVELVGFAPGVDPYAAEVRSERVLHRAAHPLADRPPAGGGVPGGPPRSPVPRPARRPARERPAGQRLRHPVRLALEGVVGRADLELALEHQLLHAAVAVVALELEQGGPGEGGAVAAAGARHRPLRPRG